MSEVYDTFGRKNAIELMIDNIRQWRERTKQNEWIDLSKIK